jgi:hypothetical protein
MKQANEGNGHKNGGTDKQEWKEVVTERTWR